MNNFTFGKLALVAALAFSASPVQVEAQTGKSNWSPAGPVLTAGRARNIIADRTNPNLLYTGSASSGLFKSENGGALWTPVNDQDSVRNISYVAQAISGEIYAGTGEGFLSYPQKQSAQIGVGLYRLEGTSLKLVASAAAVGTVINRVACSPVNANVIALATNKGVLISSDKGASFANAPGVATATDIVGMDVKFDGNGVLYCTAGDQRGHIPFDIVKSRIYRSDDANLSTFKDITPAALTTFTPYAGRIELAIAPSDNNVIYASVANKNTSPPAAVNGNGSATLKGLYVSYNGGNSWGLILQGSQQLDPLSDGFGGAYGHYAHALAVHPTNKDILFVAGWLPFKFVRDRSRGSDANPIGDWEQLGQPFSLFNPDFLRSVIHDIEIIPGSPTRYYYVTDGGIFRSLDENDSFQPFFKGMITSQFNSVSIDAWPMPIGGVTPGVPVVPARGFIGGTSGSGLVFFAGTADAVAGERVFTGDAYNAEYSKNLPDAAIYATGDGFIMRNSSVRSGAPQGMMMATYTGPIGQLGLSSSFFTSNSSQGGIPFSLWENWGQLKNTPDQLTFYNDTVRGEGAILGPDPAATAVNMANTRNFTISIPRPVKAAKIDSIVIRTGTVQVLTGGGTAIFSPPYTDRKTVTLKLKDGAPTQTFSNVLGTSTGTVLETRTVTVFEGTNVIQSGAFGTVTPRVEYMIRKIPVDPVTIDHVAMSFDDAPFKSQPTGTTSSGTDHGGFYKVFATVYYKYNTGDTIYFPDNSITNRSYTLAASLAQPLRWSYNANSFPVQTLTATTNTAIPNSTFVLLPGGQTNSSPSFTVQPPAPTNYTIQQRGTYSLQGTPVTYTLVADNSSVTPGDTFTLSAESTTAISTNTTGMFEVEAADAYSITAPTFTNPAGDVLFTTTISPSTYSLEPGGTTSTVNMFVVSPLASTTYTIYGVASSTLGTDTETTQATTVANTTMTAGSQNAPFSVTNPIVQVPSLFSARLAVAASNNGLTGNKNAVLVSRNPLSLNDPVSFVRVSQSGAKKDDQNGNPSDDLQTVNGRATVLEWSKSGTELYYATDANELYRVSHITDIFDLSNTSYGGKFYTDVFQYNSTGVNNAALNPNSPYRTTLIGKFDKPITSIRVKFDDTHVLVTLNGAATGTSGTVYYSTNSDIRKCGTNVTWENKSAAPITGIPTYCSLIEMDDNNKVFVGTDRGLFYTNNIGDSPATWVNVNTLADPEGYLPRVRIYDIEQQTRDHFDAFNSREIYVATYGRGVWSNNYYFVPYVTEVEEQESITRFENNLSLFPNPTNGVVNVSFDAMDNETVTVYVMDINGRTVKTENLGQLAPGETTFKIDTSEMNSGVYIVNISGSSALKRVAKLIVTK